MTDFASMLRGFLQDAKRHAVKWPSLSRDEKQAYVLEQIRSFVGEINSAYLEQRSGTVNYRLTGDDVTALWSQLEWLQYRWGLELWRRDPENDAAWQINERKPEALTDHDRERLKTQPSKPEKPRSSLPADCPDLPTIDQPRQWDQLVGMFLNARRPTGPQGE